MNITTKLQYGYCYIVYYIKFCLLIQYIIEHPPLVIAVPVETKGLGGIVFDTANRKCHYHS